MSIRIHSRAELRAQFGYIDSEGTLSHRAIADALRAPLNRWGLSPKREILKYARDEFRAAGIHDLDDVPRVLQRLVGIGECAEVYIENESYLAPATPRWIKVGDNISSYIGVTELPHGLSVLHCNDRDIVRKFRVESDEDIATLDISGVQEVSLSDWLMPLGYLRHASRRMRRPARSDEVSLGVFWDLLEKEVFEQGLPISDDAEVRFLQGQPGNYFGSHKSTQLEGRWTLDPGEGLWCAYRRGYSKSHWIPCIAAVFGDSRRALDLFDNDEWHWAMLARGRRTGADEVVLAENRRVKLSFPVPSQLRSAMDILGSPSGEWGVWEMYPNCVDLWQTLA